MPNRKRAPHKQLIEAGNMAREMLIAKGYQTRESAIDALSTTKGMPMLPGLPAYLPHQWTLKAAQRIMYDLLRDWQRVTAKKPKRQEKITEFIGFAVRKMNKIEKKYESEQEKQSKIIDSLEEAPLLQDVFAPWRKKETAKALNKFFVDSFAVAIIVKSNSTTSEYADWFLSWTDKLYNLWPWEEDNSLYNLTPEENKARIVRVKELLSQGKQLVDAYNIWWHEYELSHSKEEDIVSDSPGSDGGTR